MKWIVLIMLSINVCNAQFVLIEKKYIEFCNEKAEAVDSLRNIVKQNKDVIVNQDKIHKNDSTLIEKHKIDSLFQTKISLKKDTIVQVKNVHINKLNKRITILGVSLGLETLLLTLLLL